MLRAVLKTLLQGIVHRRSNGATSSPSFPVDELKALKQLHERAPIDLHTQILFGEAKIGAANALQLYKDCIRESDTGVSAWKAFISIQAALNLANYFLYSLNLEGARVECGVFRGFSALFACRAAASKLGTYSGAGFHLIDSFKGFPKPQPADFIPVRTAANKASTAPAFTEGEAAAPLEHARHVLRDYPDIRFHRGFIPQIFAELPQTSWAYVHVDVDLYEPTLASLQYFYPRMAKGGVLICDDYGSKLFPGAHKAWDEYCKANELAFVILGTGQSVLVK